MNIEQFLTDKVAAAVSTLYGNAGAPLQIQKTRKEFEGDYTLVVDEVQTDLGEMIIYQSDEGVRLDVRLENKTVWLNQEQIGALFNKSKATISEHIFNIFKEGELEEKVVCR